VAVCALYPSEVVMLIGPWRDDRPKQCQDHKYPHRICPIGLDVLGLTLDGDGVAARGIECRDAR